MLKGYRNVLLGMRKYRAPLLCTGCGWTTLCGKLGDNLWVIYDNPKWTGSLHSSGVRGDLQLQSVNQKRSPRNDIAAFALLNFNLEFNR